MKTNFFNNISKKKFDLKNLKELKKNLLKHGFVIKRKPFHNFDFKFKEYKSLYLTGISSLTIILFAFIMPLSIDIDNQIPNNLDAKINSSKSDFQKV